MNKKKSSDAGKVVGKALNLTGLLQYQQGAVVSRTLVDKDAGTVTLFAFDKGEGLSEHTAPYDATVVIMEGAAEIGISGKAHRVNAGEMIIMPAGKPHALRAVERFRMLLVMIRSAL